MISCQNENAMPPPTIAKAGESRQKASWLTCSAPSCGIEEPSLRLFQPDLSVNSNQGHCYKRSKHGKLTLKLPIKINY